MSAVLVGGGWVGRRHRLTMTDDEDRKLRKLEKLRGTRG
jgi:hypothetical protein